MKILCPTDFSPVAANGIEYAARLAQRMNATLTIVHAQPVYMSEGVSLFAGGEPEWEKEAKGAEAQMQDICTEIKNTFKTPCDYKIIYAVGDAFEKAIADTSDEYDLTVIGTNGADKVSQMYLGSHSYRVAKKESGPIIIVPEECQYTDITNIVFASDCHTTDKLFLEQLKEITKVYRPQFRVVHISEKDTAVSREVYRSFCNLAEEALNYDQQIIFERVIHENTMEAIEDFMQKTKADLLALYMEKHSLLYKMFHKSLVKWLTSKAPFPILVFHK